MGIDNFYAVSVNVGPDTDVQLAKIVSAFLTTRLADDKLKEKLTACLAHKNCAGIVSPRVNAEIWEKLSNQTKSRLWIVRKQRRMAGEILSCFFRSGGPPLLARKIIPTKGAAAANEISQSLPAKRSGHIDVINTGNSKVMPLLYLASIPATVTNTQFQAGDTRLHHDEWKFLTSDRFIRQTVALAGATLEFDANTVQLSQPCTIKLSDYELHGIDNQITYFLKSGIIERATHCNGEFVSNINLIDLNQLIIYHHFKMDTIDTVINLIIIMFMMDPVGPMVQRILNHKCCHSAPPCRADYCQGLKVFQF